jgi:hypothetical protein
VSGQDQSESGIERPIGRPSPQAFKAGQMQREETSQAHRVGATDGSRSGH